MSETSPTPWIVRRTARYRAARVIDATGKPIVVEGMTLATDRTPEVVATTDRIVQAVNCHAEMVEALKEAEAMLESYASLLSATRAETSMVDASIRKIRSALARATQTNTGE